MTRYETTQQVVALDALDACENNPNVMGDKDVATLAKAMGRFGELQPILVATNGAPPGRFRIVDGHHRSKAALVAERVEIAAVVLPPDYPLEDEKMLRISMNRLRGELDLGIVAEVLAEMVNAGHTHEELLLTGYSEDEVNALLRAANTDPDADDLMGQHLGDETAVRPTPSEFILEVAFETKADMAKAKRRLRRAAAGGSLGTALLVLIEGE
jgi:ParB-like chromosome segregation protein Spo0J